MTAKQLRWTTNISKRINHINLLAIDKPIRRSLKTLRGYL